MPRHSVKIREQARHYYLTGEVTSLAEIARRLRVNPHTVASWKRGEHCDGLRLTVAKRAAGQLGEKLASERVALNAQHFKLWNAVASKLVGSLTKEGLHANDVRTLEKAAAILERAQKGQRLARGMALDGQTEEQIRAESAAAQRHIVDVVIEVVKTEVRDEQTRDRIARLLLERLRDDDDGDGGQEAA